MSGSICHSLNIYLKIYFKLLTIYSGLISQDRLVWVNAEIIEYESVDIGHFIDDFCHRFAASMACV